MNVKPDKRSFGTGGGESQAPDRSRQFLPLRVEPYAAPNRLAAEPPDQSGSVPDLRPSKRIMRGMGPAHHGAQGSPTSGHGTHRGKV